MSDENHDLMKLARENYGWIGVVLTAVTLLLKEPRQAFLKWWRTPSWKQLMANSWSELATEVRGIRKSLDGINSSFQDVSKQAEIAAEVSRLALNDSETPRWETDENGECVWVNSALAKLFGMHSSEMLGTGWTKAIAPGHAEATMSYFKRAYHDHDFVYSATYPVLVGNEYRNLHARQVGVIRGDDGKIIRMFGICRLVETQKAA